MKHTHPIITTPEYRKGLADIIKKSKKIRGPNKAVPPAFLLGVEYGLSIAEGVELSRQIEKSKEKAGQE